LLRALDNHALSLQSAQLTRARNYDDSFNFDVRPPQDAPSWACVAQDTPANTDYLPSQTEDEGTREGNGEKGAKEKKGNPENKSPAEKIFFFIFIISFY
jgi:hypothetical protein